MRRRDFAFAAVLSMLIVTAGAFSNTSVALAKENGMVTVESKMSFPETVASLKKMVSGNGMMVLSTLDQGKILAMTGLKLNAMCLFIGNPTIGKKLFSADPAVGLAVPVRVNIYEARNGNTYVSYIKPSAQLAPYKNKKIQMIGMMLSKKLRKMTDMISK